MPTLTQLPPDEMNATITYGFELDGDLSEDHVRREVRLRYPDFVSVKADHFRAHSDGNPKFDRPARWVVTVWLRRLW